MTPSTQHAWAVVEHGKPLQKIEVPIPTPTGTEILIKVTHCGVCHSDLHFWEGFYDLGGGKRTYVKDRGAKLPRALGHEILGVVAKLGPDADPIPIGSSRAVYPWVGCQKCGHCEDENDNLCVAQNIRGIFSHGGFAQYITIPHARYLVDYGSIDPSIACTFGCSGLTVLSSIQKLMPLKPQEPVLLIGAGGLGLACISMLHALGHKNIVTADISPQKRQAALDGGATAVVDSLTKDPDPVTAALQTAGRPFSGAIDFVGNKQTAEFALASVGKGGKVITVGIMGGEMAVSLVPFTFGAKSLIGNITGTPQHLRDVAKIAQSGRLNAIPITKIPWDQANDALQRLHQGKVTGRLVLIH